MNLIAHAKVLVIWFGRYPIVNISSGENCRRKINKKAAPGAAFTFYRRM